MKPRENLPAALVAMIVLGSSATPVSGAEPGELPGGPPAVSAATAPSPPVRRRFNGLDRHQAAHVGEGSLAPETSLAVSRFHVLEAAGSALRLSGLDGREPEVASLNDFFGSPYPPRFLQPRVVYDDARARFVVAALAVDETARTSSIHFALSRDGPLSLGDAESWCAYEIEVAFNAGAPAFAGSLGLGFNGSWLALTADAFRFRDGGLRQAMLFAVERSSLVDDGSFTCPSPRIFRFNLVRDAARARALAVQPAVHLTASASAGDPLYLVASQAAREESDVYTLWRLTANGEGARPTLTRFRLTAAAPYARPPAAPQRGAPDLDTGDARITQAVFRDGRLHAVHATGCARGPVPDESCVRLLEIVPDDAGARLSQEDLGRRNVFLWAPGVAVNALGDVALAFQRGRDGQFLSLSYVVRRAAEAGFANLRNLSGGQCALLNFDAAGRNRTNLSAAVQVDPLDDFGFWIAGEYPGPLAAGGCDWRTRVGLVRDTVSLDPMPGHLAGGEVTMPTTGTRATGNSSREVRVSARLPQELPATAGRRLFLGLRDLSRPGITCDSDHPLSGCMTLDYPLADPETEASWVELGVQGGRRTFYLVISRALADRPDPAAPE